MLKACVIVQNHPGVTMGGAQYQGHLLAEELAHRPGVEVTYLARDIPADAAQRFGTRYAIRSMGTWRGIRRRAAWFDAPQLWRTLRALQPDVIYQQMRQSYTAVCAHYARSAHVPFFFQLASDLDIDPAWFSGGISSNLPFDLIESIAGLWGLRRADYILAQTTRQARILRERLGLEAAAVVRNFQPLPECLPEKAVAPVEVFWVANFKDVKRPELFVRLAEEFHDRNDVKFTMAGRPSNQRRRFGPLMERIGQMENLEYLGELSIEEVNRRMAQAHIHVNTSSFEGFPNTFIQAWAQGAIVTTIAVDPDEGMEGLGIGICAGTFDRLRSVIDELVRNPERRRVIAARAFQFAHANHSLDRGARLADLMLEKAEEARARRWSTET
jgi:glycosyltransferase involved in cell wall biosynthesis